MLLLLLSGCEREKRPLTLPPAASDTQHHTAAARRPALSLHNPYEDNAWAASQGKALFKRFNCAGCHGQGGGGIGPALMDAKWLYGADPGSVFQSIAYGRPNGMPAFKDHVPEDQIWQLVAYVRSMSGQLSKNVAPSRGDNTQASDAPENRRSKEPVLAQPREKEGKQP
ncbi:MAG: c-type cytochrome [Telluria sp.]